MKELVIISGNGSAGKTALVAAFASVSRSKVICDAGLHAAGLPLILAPEVKERHEFQPGGEWFVSNTRFGPMVHAALAGAQEDPVKVVTLIRREGRKLAQATGADLVLTDGPSVSDCPMSASVHGATTALIMVEPTVSGRSDLARLADLASSFEIPAMVCVNKFDLNPGLSRAIEADADQRKISCVGRIPFDATFARAAAAGKTIFEYDRDSRGCSAVMDVCKRVILELEFMYGNPIRSWFTGGLCSRLGSVGFNLVWQ